MGKRGNGEGYVYQNAKKRWIVRTQVGWLDNGKPKFKTFSGHTRAEALMRKKEYDEKHNALKNADESLLKNAMSAWLLNKKKICLKPSSFSRLKLTVEKNLIPKIGRFSVSELTPDIIQEKIINNMMEEGNSWSTIKKCYDALNNFYKQCIADRMTLYNPVSGVIMPAKQKFNTKKTRSLTPEEITKFESACSSVYSNNQPIYRHGYGYIFILYTGMRSGEAMALQYKHINLDKKTVTVEQTMVCIDNDDKLKKGSSCKAILQKNTKSESGCRVIPICDKAFSAIKEHIRINYKGNDNDFVFASNDNKPMLYRNFRKSINSVYKRAGIDATGFHILRHTIGSLMFAKKIDIKYISAFLGHSGIQVTYDSYIHLIKDFESDFIKSMNSI